MTDIEKLAMDTLKIQIENMNKEKNSMLSSCKSPTEQGMILIGFNGACERFYQAYKECFRIIEIITK